MNMYKIPTAALFRFVLKGLFQPLSDYLLKPALVLSHNCCLVPTCGLCYNLNLLFTNCIYPCCKILSYINCNKQSREPYWVNHYEALDIDDKLEMGLNNKKFKSGQE